MRRTAGILFGILTHALFAFTVWHLVWFLKGAEPGGTTMPATAARDAAIDALLALAFAVPHSLLLMPAVRRSIVARGLAAPLYGCFYCVATCLALLTTMLCWRPIGVVLWRTPPPCDAVVSWAFVGAWAALLYSLHLTGLGWQTGLTPWWHWVRGRPAPRRDFVERGAYRVLRHPVYLSFLGLVWLVPVVTLDRAVLMAVWSAYIMVGSVLKDRRLLHFLGARYREYQARVPGYPGMPCGPLARLKAPTSTVLLAVALCLPTAGSAEEQANYDEAQVRRYTLPDPLAGPDGAAATTPDAWRLHARPHQLAILEANVYGRRLPTVPVVAVGDVERTDVSLAGDVAATRIQARLRLGAAEAAPVTDVLLYLPRGARAAPCFLGLNFRGNHAQHPDPAIRLPRGWIPNDPRVGITDNRATDASRGVHAATWPVERMLGRGYALATAYYGDTFSDRPDGRATSALVSLGRPIDGPLPPDEPGAIATWAWQLSRILDWLVTLPEIDATRVVVVGHSRLGKTALWAGAVDERFAMVVSNESGCGGAALSRRNYGETVRRITTVFPHWFCPAFATFADRETELPCDQHTLLAMTAPRPLYVASAVEDRWADPRGEFLAAVAAGPAWRLFGRAGLGTTQWPPVDTPVGGTIGYHVRSGQHDLLPYDWERFADHADRTLRDRPNGSPAATR